MALDSNLRLKLWPLARARAVIGAAMALTDYFFPSLEDVQALSGLSDGDAIIDWAHRLGARNVLLKLGERGSDRERWQPPRSHPRLQGGCGGCHGRRRLLLRCPLARLAAGDSLWDAARYANAAAALSTTGFGAVAPLPDPAAVRELLARAS